MGKKAKVFLISVVCIVACLVVMIVIKPYIQKKQWEIQYQKMLQAVDELNANSYLYGVGLLREPPKDHNRNGINIFPGTENDSYSCKQYYDIYGVFAISIWSKGAHVFGIHVGDSYEESVAVLKDRGYKWQEVPPSTAEDDGKSFKYVKDHAAIWLRVSSENSDVIEAIGVNVFVIEE